MDAFLNLMEEYVDDQLKESQYAPRYITYEIDMTHGSIKVLPSHPAYTLSPKMDFPTINEQYRFGKNCYTYGIVDHPRATSNLIVKRNNCDHPSETTWYKERHYPTEPLFVPNPEGIAEDDGVLLSTVFDGTAEKSYLLILDATTMTLISETYAPVRIPFTLHGQFILE